MTITMNEALALVLAAVAGGALGVIFFGGLWWTVRKSLSARQPALWVFVSLLLRMGLTMSGFYWVSGGGWQRLLACLAGFIIARQILVRLSPPPVAPPALSTQEASHAP